MNDQRPADPRPGAASSSSSPPTTGDPDVDRVLSEFVAAVHRRDDIDGSADRDQLAGDVEAATRAHRGLQNRLSSPRG
ncbi:MAG: hypothetical protein WBG89_12885 [Ornithinimicrobium sp.]